MGSIMQESQLHPYQRHAIRHILDNPSCALFLDMGLGKTIATLTAISRLVYDECEISRVLVIAPLRVAADTWSRESAKWEHTRHLKLSIVLGTLRQRCDALNAKADIYIINRENVTWLINSYQKNHFPFDMIVIDELSSFKSAKAQRFKSLKRVLPLVKRVVGLTGTPAPNGLIDLWPQLYLLDQGKRLGKTITAFRSEYFVPGRRNANVIFDYKLKKGSDKRITGAISDICISMKSVDYILLPEKLMVTREVHLPAEVQKRYDDFEREQVMLLQDEGDISAANAAALSTKLRQFANGAVYDDERRWHQVHDVKIEALQELVEAAAGNPVLVFYAFLHDVERIAKALKEYQPRMLDTAQDISDWNAGDIRVLLAHPASAGHGLNLQAGGSQIIWFGLNWSLELYQQANARLWRQGQEKPVTIHHLVMVDTIDTRVMKALQGKTGAQDALMQAVKAIIHKHTNSNERNQTRSLQLCQVPGMQGLQTDKRRDRHEIT